MIKCKKCGAELEDKVTYCPYCGNQVNAIITETIPKSEYVATNENDKTGQTLGILSIVFFETFIIGLILGIIGLTKSVTKKDKTLNKIGIGLSIASFVLGIILMILAILFSLGLFNLFGTIVQEGVNQGVESLTA